MGTWWLCIQPSNAPISFCLYIYRNHNELIVEFREIQKVIKSNADVIYRVIWVIGIYQCLIIRII